MSRTVHLTVKSLIHRFQTVLGEVMKFGVVGAVNIGINFVVFLALAVTVFTGSELKANVAATAFATTTSYLMNRHWTFRHRPKSTMRREYPLFILFNVAGLAIELAVMGAAKYGLGMTSLTALTIAKALGIGIGTVFRFWTYRTFVFATRRTPRPAQPDAEIALAPAADDTAGDTAAGAAKIPARLR